MKVTIEWKEYEIYRAEIDIEEEALNNFIKDKDKDSLILLAHEGEVVSLFDSGVDDEAPLFVHRNGMFHEDTTTCVS